MLKSRRYKIILKILLVITIIIIKCSLGPSDNDECIRACHEGRDECFARVQARDPFDLDALDECNRQRDRCIANCD